ncbi:MAG: nitrogen fixation protein NifH, partial [Candidatus Aminicenantes bacterium]|nr:nitrogen fixation protein NifH [Candidatus Aminicenantes bacterium]
LLEEDNPSVRFFTLVDLLGATARDRRVAAARKAIMERGPVPKILAKQKKGGYWGEPKDFYVRAKYRGTVWQLIVLAELGADPNDPRIRRAGEFVLRWSQDRESGGFSYRGGPGGGGQPSGVIPCLTGNMVWSLIRLGFGRDPRVGRGIGWLTRFARFDDGEGPAPPGRPYDRFEACWGRHTCHSGVAKTLKALAAIRAKDRTPEIGRTIAAAAEYFLRHRVYKRSHDPSKTVKPKWLKFGFPLMWDSDALEIFGLLAGLGYRDQRMRDAAELVLSKRDAAGRWALEETCNGRFLVDIEKKGRPSKWVTLNALRALKAHQLKAVPTK